MFAEIQHITELLKQMLAKKGYQIENTVPTYEGTMHLVFNGKNRVLKTETTNLDGSWRIYINLQTRGGLNLYNKRFVVNTGNMEDAVKILKEKLQEMPDAQEKVDKLSSKIESIDFGPYSYLIERSEEPGRRIYMAESAIPRLEFILRNIHDYHFHDRDNNSRIVVNRKELKELLIKAEELVLQGTNKKFAADIADLIDWLDHHNEYDKFSFKLEEIIKRYGG